MSNIFQNIKQKGRDLIRDIYFLLDSYNPKKKKGIYTYNWWTDKNEDFWVWRFIKYRFNPLNRVIFFSCWRNKVRFIEYFRGINIFYSLENLQTKVFDGVFDTQISKYGTHRLNEVNLGIGCEFRKEENYYRFPYWIVHNDFISPEFSLNEIKNKINAINKFENRFKPKNQGKVGFSVLISSHDISGHRQRLKDIADKIAPVTCAGKFANNTNDLYEKYDNNKLEYMRNFRFNICPENSLGEGYITEKVFESIAAGCIPIYYGAYLEPDILNPEAILLYEEGKEKELEDKIRLLWENEEEYKKFISIPPFKEGAAEKIWDIIQGLENKISEIIK